MLLLGVVEGAVVRDWSPPIMPAFTPYFTFWWRLDASALNYARVTTGLRL